MIPQSFIQDLLNRLDIVAVVERYVPLKKAGANYVACCPFHTEKSPSFTVSPAKQFYHCFGCGAHGTAISFVMEYAGMGFVEAVKELAAGVGMPVPDERPDKDGVPAKPKGSEQLYEMMAEAAKFYRAQLRSADRAIAYLKSRGLSGEVAARFGIGYAPPGWHGLREVFPDYDAPGLTECGLVIQGDDGKRYDRFRDRIMFPIQDQRGRVIGFGGRVIGQGEPKYLNSPETPLFEKGRELYGAVQAREGIRRVGRVLVVEGYMDVVALAQSGVDYALATLGTATTPIHVQKLLRLADQVVFCFDGDDAGRRAAWRALENSLEHLTDSKEVRFLFLPQGEDPDSYVRSAGRQAFESLLAKESLILSAFLMRELVGRVDLQTEEGRARLLQTAKPLVAQVQAPALALLLKKRLAESAGITQEELDRVYDAGNPGRSRLGSSSGGAFSGSAEGKSGLSPGGRRRPVTLPRKLLCLLMLQPQLGSRLDTRFPGAADEATIALNLVLEFLGDNPHIISADEILAHFQGTPFAVYLREAVGDAVTLGALAEEEAAAELRDGLARVEEMERNRRLDALRVKDGAEGLTAQEKAEFLQLVHGRRRDA